MKICKIAQCQDKELFIVPADCKDKSVCVYEVSLKDPAGTII